MGLRGLRAGIVLFFNLILTLWPNLAFSRSANSNNLFQNLMVQVQQGVSVAQADRSVGSLDNPGGGFIDRHCDLGSPLDPYFRPIHTMKPYNQGLYSQEARVEAPDSARADSNLPGAYLDPNYPLRNPEAFDRDLETRLDHCAILRDHIVWERPDGSQVSYPDWEPEQKARLNDLFHALLAEQRDLGLACPDPVASHPASHNRQYLTAEQAFDVFAAHVAHVLYVEARHRVPWSVAQDSGGELDQLLNSTNYQSIIVPSAETNYPPQIQVGRDYQQTKASDGTMALLCDPRVGFQFLTGVSADHPRQRENLLGSSEEETLVNLTYFFRKNVAHGGGETEEQLEHRSLLKDRLQTEAGDMIWATAGCHGASQLLQDLARSINIPLLNIGTQENPANDGHYDSRTHRGLAFKWEGPRARVLWHTDEIYAIAYIDPVFPIDSSGAPLNLTASKHRFFETYWPAPRTLQAWGFQYHPQIVSPEVGFGAHSRGTFEDYENFGWMGGYWLRSDRLEAYLASGGALDDHYRQMSGDLSYQYELENLYQNCGWDLVSTYAQYGSGARPGFDSYIQDKFGGRSRSGLTARQFRSLDEYWDRAVACVDAYGGPEAVRTLHDNWESGRGLH